MDSNTTLFAVARTLSLKGEPENANANEIVSLHRSYSDALKECEMQARILSECTNWIHGGNDEKRYTYHSTTDYHTDAEGNYTEQETWPKVENIGACDWDMAYQIRLQYIKNPEAQYHPGFCVLQWVDFSY